MSQIKTIIVDAEHGLAIEKVAKKVNAAGEKISLGINVYPNGSVIKLYDTDRYDYITYTLTPEN